MVEQSEVQYDFAASEKARRENLIARAGPEVKLAPVRTQIRGEADI